MERRAWNSGEISKAEVRESINLSKEISNLEKR